MFLIKFPLFINTHCLKKVSLLLPAYETMFFGYFLIYNLALSLICTMATTAFIAFMANPLDKIIYIYDEFYKTRMLNSDIARTIKEKGYAKERIRADSAEPKSNEDLRRLGITRIIPSI